MVKGKALVTGAGRGIGRAMAVRLASEGYAVAGVARSQADLAETAAAVERSGGRFRALAGDLGDAAVVGRVVAEAAEALDGLTLLVNNAGLAPLGPVESMSGEEFEAQLSINVRAVFYACQAAIPHLRQSGGGVIVNVSSVAAVDPFPGFAAYGASKAWVNLFTQALARELAGEGIRVYALAPGAVDTRMLRSALPDFPPERCLRPEDVAGALIWLLDERARYATGQTVYVRKEP